MDFSSCVIWNGFCKSSHICMCNASKTRIQTCSQINYSLSLSTITTSVVKSSPSIVPNGNDISTIVILNVSSSSASKSSCIEILNEEQLVPTGNVTMYCVVSKSP